MHACTTAAMRPLQRRMGSARRRFLPLSSLTVTRPRATHRERVGDFLKRLLRLAPDRRRKSRPRPAGSAAQRDLSRPPLIWSSMPTSSAGVKGDTAARRDHGPNAARRALRHPPRGTRRANGACQWLRWCSATCGRREARRAVGLDQRQAARVETLRSGFRSGRGDRRRRIPCPNLAGHRPAEKRSAPDPYPDHRGV